MHAVGIQRNLHSYVFECNGSCDIAFLEFPPMGTGCKASQHSPCRPLRQGPKRMQLSCFACSPGRPPVMMQPMRPALDQLRLPYFIIQGLQNPSSIV